MEPLRRHARPGQHAAGLPGAMGLPQAPWPPERDAARSGIRLPLRLCRHRTHAAERLQNARMQRRERSPVDRRVHELGERRPTSRLRCPNFFQRMRPQVLSRCLQARPTSDGADILGLDGTPQTPHGSDALSLTRCWAVCARTSASERGQCPTHCAAGRRRGAVSCPGPKLSCDCSESLVPVGLKAAWTAAAAAPRRLLAPPACPRSPPSAPFPSPQAPQAP